MMAMWDTARFLAVAAAATLLACSGDVFVTPDAGADASVDGGACADLTFCDNKCGAGLADKCGASRDCGGCGEGRTCDGLTHLCSCTAIPLNVWCVKKCGLTKDNCGTSVDCGGCVVPKTCANNSCDTCVDDGQACNGKACGTAVNNCGQTVLCGGVCSGSCNNGVCCDPPSVTCAGNVCGTIQSNCGLPVVCGCLVGRTCCGGKCTNVKTDLLNCGACGASCAGISNANLCEGGGCTCTGHGSNTDPGNCGPCGGTAIGMKCSGASRTTCTAGACFP